MTGTTTLAHHTDVALRPDPARVLARLFLPGEELVSGRSRASGILARTLALPEDEVESLAAQLIAEFSPRHRDYQGILAAHRHVVESHLPKSTVLSAARAVLIGACFTAEYAVEGAAICNPSPVLHPDQSGLAAGQVRLAVSLRGIGEGHLSSIGFVEAIVGPGATWTFQPRVLPAVAGTAQPPHWGKARLQSVLEDMGQYDGLAHDILAALPETFTDRDVNRVLFDVNQDVLARPGGPVSVDRFRRTVASIYRTAFPADISISQQVLFPVSADESNGMEDGRFVRFVVDGDAEQRVEYRATYTAYDGRNISPRLLISPDLREFRIERLIGPAVRNKGMALFPRLVGGRHLALFRSDGESTGLARSDDGLNWARPELLHSPGGVSWEVLQVGNCGSPIETDRGWVVLTHGVGPMRTYRIGAMLLDLEDPSRVVGELKAPLLQADPNEWDGYVPNVVYTCGGLLHDGLLWIPYGVGDARIRVAWVSVADLLAAIEPMPS